MALVGFEYGPLIRCDRLALSTQFLYGSHRVVHFGQLAFIVDHWWYR
jgi:hypothetical protein